MVSASSTGSVLTANCVSADAAATSLWKPNATEDRRTLCERAERQRGARYTRARQEEDQTKLCHVMRNKRLCTYKDAAMRSCYPVYPLHSSLHTQASVTDRFTKMMNFQPVPLQPSASAESGLASEFRSVGLQSVHVG